MIIRGNTVLFSETFKNAAGVSVTPQSAELHLSFRNISGGTGSADLSMANDGDGNWQAAWDSSVAKAGTVWWSLLVTSGLQLSRDGKFTLRANRANTPTDDYPEPDVQYLETEGGSLILTEDGEPIQV